MKKFTFKTIKSTGRWRSFEGDYILIKLNGKECGNIRDNEQHTIGFMVIKDDIMEDGNKNCIWKWIFLKDKFSSLNEAKEFLNINFDKFSKLNLYLIDK